jgi:hypothetical protein
MPRSPASGAGAGTLPDAACVLLRRRVDDAGCPLLAGTLGL